MYAYVYNKANNKYYSLNESQIDNFEYDDVGHQSKEFASKPFMCKIKFSNGPKTIPCQILTVADDMESLHEYVKDHRPCVPRLNTSDLEVKNPSPKSNRKAAKEQAKVAAAKKKKAGVKVTQTILDGYTKQLTDGQPNDKNDVIQTIDKAGKQTDNNGLLFPDEESNNDEETPSVSEQNSEDDTRNENSGGNEIEALKEKLRNERRLKQQALNLNNKLQDRYKQVKQSVQKQKAEQDEENKSQAVKELKRNGFGFPTPICTESNVMVRTSALEEAYAKTEPSKFYINMCYATWGYKELSTRCIKVTKKKQRTKLQ